MYPNKVINTLGQRVAVVGLGAVGGYIAAHFAKAGVDVVGFARAKHLEAIEKNGIKIEEDSECWNVHLDARELEDLDGYFEGYFDIVLFCVKSYDLVDAYEHIKSHIDKNTVLLSFSNGVNNGDVLRKLSKASVLDGCVYILSHIEKAGVIRKKGKLFCATFGGDKKAVKALGEIFEKAKLRFKTPEDIQTALWQKYIFISAFATLCSYYNKSIGAVYEYHYDEAKTLLEEIALVAKAKGVNIVEEVQKALKSASKVPYDSLTSMHLDFRKKKKVELESLCGFVAKEQSVQTPTMEKMYRALLKKQRL